MEFTGTANERLWGLGTRTDVIHMGLSRPTFTVSDKLPIELVEEDPKVFEVGESITLTQGTDEIDATYPENEVLNIGISSTLVDFFKAITSLVHKTNIIFGPNGIGIIYHLVVPDAFIQVSINAKDLDKYRIKEGRTIAKEVDLTIMHEKMKEAKGGEIKILEEDTNNLRFYIGPGVSSLHISQAVDMDFDREKIPPQDSYHTVLCTPASMIKSIFPGTIKKDKWLQTQFSVSSHGVDIITERESGMAQYPFMSSIKSESPDGYHFTRFEPPKDEHGKIAFNNLHNTYNLMGGRKIIYFSISDREMVEFKSVYGQMSFIKITIPYAPEKDGIDMLGEAAEEEDDYGYQ